MSAQPPAPPPEPSPDPPTTVEVAIVGAGFSGLGMGIQLARAGQRDFLILEQSDALGGTWRDNHYPGCACDVPAHLYSYSFAPNPRWTCTYAGHAEIRTYLDDCASRFHLRPHLRLGVQVVDARFDEATGRWHLQTARGQRVIARHVALGVGGLSRPALPAIPGLERFAGPVFHSARWDEDADLRGRRVAVIGTGASAIQLIPRIAPEAARLHVFQRTPPWILPRADRDFGPWERRLLTHLPGARRLLRAAIYWRHEVNALAFTVHPGLMARARRAGLQHIAAQIPDPALRAAVTPTYTPGCKRVLLSNDYYPALTLPQVELVTDPIARVTPGGLQTRDGTTRPVDAIICGTGFRVTDMLSPLTVTGRGGVDLNAAWRDGIGAYLGTLVAGFPNLHVLLGPNSGLGHNSVVFMLEAQLHVALQLMAATRRRGAAWVDVRPGAQEAFNRGLQARLQRTVWASGCDSWYLTRGGRNVTLWPGFTWEFWLRTRRIPTGALQFGHASERGARGRSR